MQELDQIRSAKKRVLGTLAQHGIHASIGITRISGHYGLKINVEQDPTVSITNEMTEGIPFKVEMVGKVRKH